MGDEGQRHVYNMWTCFAYHSAWQAVRPVVGPRGHVIRRCGEKYEHSTHSPNRAICHHASCLHERCIKQVAWTHAYLYSVFFRGSHDFIAISDGERHWLFYQDMTTMPHS